MAEPKHRTIKQFVREKSEPFVTTGDVAEEFDQVTRRTINHRLNDLHDRGELEKREVGANSVVWFIED